MAEINNVIAEASQDLQTIEDFVNLPADSEVYPRLLPSVNVGTLAGTRQAIFEAGGLPATPFKTKALMTASALVDGKYAQVTDDTVNNGLYVKTAGAWVKSEYDPLKQANQYTDSAVGALDLTVDTGENIHYRAKDAPTKKFSAVWSEYNKPVWHIGNGVLVDTTGATLKLLKEELVFTIKLTAANQTFLYPIRNAPDPAINATVNWGDGITTTHTDQNINHTYVGAIGDVFTIRVSGNPLHFDFSAANAARNTSRLMMRSIESNTLPKTMPYFSLLGCTNMIYLGRGALSSYTGTSLAGYFLDLNSLVIDSKVFEGLSQVTNINNLFGDASKPVKIAIPSGVLDTFVNATTAMGIFRGLSAPLPLGILDKLTSLQNVSNMFFSATVTSIDSNLFKYQTGLQDVSNTFRLASSAIANAQTLYNDMVRGNPTTTTLCFNGANSMTNLAQVPSTWK